MKNRIFHTGNCAFRALMPEFRQSRKQHNIPVHKRMEIFMKAKISKLPAVLLLVSLLAGCSNSANTDTSTTTSTDASNSTTISSSGSELPSSGNQDVNVGGYPLVDEKVEFSLMIPESRDYDEVNLLEMIQIQEERTNVHINWITVQPDMWVERKNLTLASGDMPDGMYKCDLTDMDVINYSEQGILLDLKPYMDKYGENINEVFKLRPTFLDAITLQNGQIPALPYIEDNGNMTDCQQFWYINQTWLDALDLKLPTTTDELYDVLKAFKNDDPNGNGKADEIPLTFRESRTEGLYYIMGAFGDVDNPLHLVLKDNKTYEFTADKEGYKEGIKYLNKLFSEGLLDPEGFYQDVETYTAKARNEEMIVGSIFTWRGDNLFGLERNDQDYTLMAPLKGPDGHQNWGGFLGSALIKNEFVISSNCADPDTLFRWVDSLYEPEFAVQWNWGLIYQKNDDGLLEAGTPPDGLSAPEYRIQNTLGGYVPTAILNEYYDTVCIRMESSQWRVDAIENLYREFMPEIIYPMDNTGTPFGLLPEEVAELSDITMELNLYVDEVKARWIAEGGIDDEWDNYLSQLDKLQLPRMLEIYQTGYDRFRGF